MAEGFVNSPSDEVDDSTEYVLQERESLMHERESVMRGRKSVLFRLSWINFWKVNLSHLINHVINVGPEMDDSLASADGRDEVISTVSFTIL
jgi:hypothetical protein